MTGKKNPDLLIFFLVCCFKYFSFFFDILFVFLSLFLIFEDIFGFFGGIFLSHFCGSSEYFLIVF